MGGHLTARAWLRERRRLITLMDSGAADAPSPRGGAETSLPASKGRRRLREESKAARPKSSRTARRPRLIVLSLNRREAEVPRPPWAVDPEITHTVIWLKRLPAAFEGLKIVHRTDIHHSLFTPLEEVERAVHLANRQEPDVVALTGDYVTLSPAYIRPVARALGKLRARRGVFAVLGNHDFQVNADAVTSALRAHHIRVLRNTRRPIRAGRETLWLLGVDDLWWNSDDLSAALQRVPARDTKILLCHNPLGIWQASDHGIDLVLSGHTHGGQVRLPGFGKLYRSKLGERFVEGWNVLKSTQIYVSRGIGKVVVPIRLACPSEIACLRLHRARPDLRHA
ncbi:MAG TPA: metallophosphoesterase [Terriglobia bacterium]|nr:metallophosphoesterase [Terriglobia bacterium]